MRLSPKTWDFWAIAAVLAAAALLRGWLVLHGGQFTQLDEARYLVSREASALLAQGHLWQALAFTINGGDHVGFKVLALIPALIERHYALGVAGPALFFAGFSLLNIGLIGLIGWRLSGSRAVQFWATLAAAASGSLFYFSRHLLPYDVALCFMLLALYWGTATPLVWWRPLLAGLAAGFGFVTYYGYWTLGAIVLVAGVLATWRRATRHSFWAAVARAALGVAGLVLAISLPILIDHFFGEGKMITRAAALSGTITVGDFRGHLAPWEYLWHADFLLVVFAAAGAVMIAVRCLPALRGTSNPSLIHGAWVVLLCALALQTSFLIFANGLHKFAIHDRLIRQLTPFLCLVTAFAVELFLGSRPKHRRAAALACTLLLIGNGIFSLATPLAQEFPRDFKKRGDDLLAKIEKNERPSAESYLRYVNVLHYLFEPETLQTAPIETLLAAPHFYDYVPYLFEAKTPEDRDHRRSLDQRMRLVRMPVAAQHKIRGAGYGKVTLQARFAPGRHTFVEPLLSVGPRDWGEVFFAYFSDDNRVRLGFFSTGYGVFMTDPLPIEPGRTYEVTLYSTSMLPAPGTPIPPELNPEVLARGRAHPTMVIAVDGHRVLEHVIAPKPATSSQTYAAVNAILTDYTEAEFSGDIRDAVRDGNPIPDYLHGTIIKSGIGKIELGLQAGEQRTGRPEPLLVAGTPGNALIVAIRLLPDGKAKIGLELWGYGAWESPPVEFPAGGNARLECTLGPLLPVAADAAWSQHPELKSSDWSNLISIRWAGQTVLSVPAPAALHLSGESATVGINPVGGSWAAPDFSGVIRSVECKPLTPP